MHNSHLGSQTLWVNISTHWTASFALDMSLCTLHMSKRTCAAELWFVKPELLGYILSWLLMMRAGFPSSGWFKSKATATGSGPNKQGSYSSCESQGDQSRWSKQHVPDFDVMAQHSTNHTKCTSKLFIGQVGHVHWWIDHSFKNESRLQHRCQQVWHAQPCLR